MTEIAREDLVSVSENQGSEGDPLPDLSDVTVRQRSCGVQPDTAALKSVSLRKRFVYGPSA